MEGSQPHAIFASVIGGVALAAPGILGDSLFSYRVRVVMAVIGCCLILVGVTVL
jgi:hypothetical protein